MPNNDRYHTLNREHDLSWLRRETSVLRGLLYHLTPLDRFQNLDDTSEALRKGVLSATQAAARAGFIRRPRGWTEFGYWLRNRSPEEIEAEIQSLPDIQVESRIAPALKAQTSGDLIACMQGSLNLDAFKRETGLDQFKKGNRHFVGEWREYFADDPRWEQLRTSGYFKAYPNDYLSTQPSPCLASEVEVDLRKAQVAGFRGDADDAPVSVQSYSVRLSQAVRLKLIDQLSIALGQESRVHAVLQITLEKDNFPYISHIRPFLRENTSERYLVKTLRLFVFELRTGQHGCLLAEEFTEKR